MIVNIKLIKEDVAAVIPTKKACFSFLKNESVKFDNKKAPF